MSAITGIEQLPAPEVQQWYSNIWETVTAEFPLLDETTRIRIVSLIVGTCPYCYTEAKDTCMCTRDD